MLGAWHIVGFLVLSSSSQPLIALAFPGHAKVDYQSDVRPLLSDKCFQCHGPDAATRTADLRLDRREGLFGHRPNGAPVIPGDPESSLVFQRITHTDAALRMPPEYSHKSLEPAECRHHPRMDRRRRRVDRALGL